MIVETKYSTGDTVWCMYDNKPIQGTVYKIIIDVVGKKDSAPFISIEYYVDYDHHCVMDRIRIIEKELFSSKDDLILSL